VAHLPVRVTTRSLANAPASWTAAALCRYIAQPGAKKNLPVAPAKEGAYFHSMPMTPEQIVEAASHLPREQVVELVDRLTTALHSSDEPEIESAWKQETRRRLAELENGRVQAIPGDLVSADIRKIVGR
jgi:putative addiction module component (TIGR02574 family)